MAKSSDITVNDQGLTNEEYKEKERLDKKPKKERTPEEQARLDELKQKKEGREKAISILRGISIRMPLLIYGAFITDEDRQLTIDNFTSLVDDQSWEEFMPRGVSKQVFEEFKGYYDQDIFAAAGKRIRAMARAADNLTIEERIERITNIFATFRNPDKETVLTPWRVVNMHMGDCLGGYVFFDTDNETPLLDPRYVDHGNVTNDVFAPDTTLLEINSKSGLYPLYLAYNVYRRRLSELTTSPETLEEHQALWDKTVAENIFVICKTPMAKAVTRRTLVGFRKAKVNTRYFEDLINQIKNKPDNFISKVVRGHSFWKANNNDNMKFKAIVGNPPYQVMDGGTDTGAVPVYQFFVGISQKLKPDYISLIMPSRWFAGGRGLDVFRNEMLNNRNISVLVDYPKSRDCFNNVDIAGGLCYFLIDKQYEGQTLVISSVEGVRNQMVRDLNQFDIFIRDNIGVQIIDKVLAESDKSLSNTVLNVSPFGIRSFVRGKDQYYNGALTLKSSAGISFVDKSVVTKNQELIGTYKVMCGYLNPDRAGVNNSRSGSNVTTKLVILKPNEVVTETYIILGCFKTEDQADVYAKCIKTKFTRFLVLQTLSSMHITQVNFQFVPLQDFTANSDIDWSQSVADIDRQLYEKYHLIDKEIAFIESMIKPM
jgi:hypothetical protein